MPIRPERLALTVTFLLAASVAGAQQGPAASTEEPVYLEFQVEKSAEVAPRSCYPGIPRKVAGGPGWAEVQVQFVVDTTGKADTKSLKVLKATRPELEESVRKSIPCMRFRPASIEGRPVRQLVEQSFAFRIP